MTEAGNESRLDRAHAQVAGRLTHRRVDRLIRRAGSSRWRLDRLAIVLLVLPIHAVTFGSLLSGTWLLVLGDNIPQRFLGALLLMVGFAVGPRITRRPRGVGVLREADAPALFALLAEAAQIAGTRVPDEVHVVKDFNAYALRFHVHRRAIGLGAPLWMASNTGARLSHIGHEMGHFAHGDLTQLFLVRNALQALRHWHDIATPTRRQRRGQGSNWMMAPVRWAVRSYERAIRLVAGPSNQRLEFHADLASARVAGTQGAVDGLDVLLAHLSFDVVANRAAVDPSRPDLGEAIRTRAEALTGAERQSARRRGEAESSRIDDSHPPTHQRIRLIEGRPWEAAQVQCPPERMALIDAELKPALDAALRRLAESYRFVR